MGRAKLLANASSPPVRSFRWPADASTRCVDRATWATGAERSYAPERPFLQMHTRQWLGSFGGRGNGDYRAELQAALQAVAAYLAAWELPLSCGIVRVDGQYGDSAVIAAMVATGTQIVVRKRGYRWLEHPLAQAALAHEPVATMTTRESPVTYEVFDLPQMCLEDGTTSVRFLLTRRAWKRGEPISVGKVVGEWVYEQFVTTLPPDGFLATDVLDLSHGRGAFEGTLADEDQEGDPDRWCSLTAAGQEFWQIVWQWVWNLRLSLSAGWSATSLREMEWAPAHPQTGSTPSMAAPDPAEEGADGPLEWARAWGGRLSAEAFPLQEDGMLRCPQGVRLWQSEIRQENAFTQRLIFVIFVAKDADCAPCPLRAVCLGRTASGTRGRRVSAVRHRRITEVVLSPRPFGSRSGYRVERCRRTPAAALMDGPLAPANGDAGRLACQLLATGPSSSCGPLASAPELAGALGTQCAGSAPGDEHPGHGGGTARP